MSDLAGLLGVMAALYVLECTVVMRRGAVGLASRPGGWKLARPWTPIEAVDFGFALANPLPPLGTIFICQPWPLSFSSAGIDPKPINFLGPVARTGQATRSIPLASIESVGLDGDQIRINGAKFVRAASPALAAELVRTIRTVSALSPTDRPIAVAAALAHSLDADAASGRIEAFEARSRLLRFECLLLFCYTFAIAPAMIAVWGLSQVWAQALGGFGLLWVLILVEFFRAHRELFPDQGADCASRITMMVLAPLTAMRACDILGRHLLGAFHPLAGARRLFASSTFVELAQAALRDAHFPAAPQPDPEQSEILTTAVSRFMRNSGLDPESALDPPAKEAGGCLSYCPRCHMQFTVLGECFECPGVTLVPFLAQSQAQRTEVPPNPLRPS